MCKHGARGQVNNEPQHYLRGAVCDRLCEAAIKQHDRESCSEFETPLKHLSCRDPPCISNLSMERPDEGDLGEDH